MTSLSSIDLAIAAWVLGSCAIAVFMIRRGHSPVRWVVVPFVLGPLSVVVAVWARHRSRSARPIWRRQGSRGPGPLAILVGVDGTVEAHHALVGVMDALGDRIGRLTLAGVVDFESAGKTNGPRSTVEEGLETEAELVRHILGFEPRTVLLPGAPAEALVGHALVSDDDWIVVGTHAGSEGDWIRGNIEAAVSGSAGVRVMVIGGVRQNGDRGESALS